jgi:hypothetical protein
VQDDHVNDFDFRLQYNEFTRRGVAANPTQPAGTYIVSQFASQTGKSTSTANVIHGGILELSLMSANRARKEEEKEERRAQTRVRSRQRRHLQRHVGHAS